MTTHDSWVECHLPMLGAVKARLFPLADTCYRLLEKHGHIERLHRIDQLGVIRQIYQGAHHSRWEYVMAQLALIYKLTTFKNEDGKSVAQDVGLRSTTHFDDHRGQKASGADVMQCWSLLLNAGHLNGTFATEWGLLYALRKDNNLKRAFLSTTGFHDTDARKYSAMVIDENRLYDLHKAIAFFFLHRYARGNEKGLVKTLIDVLKWYCGENQSHQGKRDNLVRIFTRIRQLCYLALDSLYSPTPMRLDLGSIFLNLEERAGDICDSAESPLCRELNGFNDLMVREVYFSPDVLLQHEHHAQHIEQTISKWYDKGMEVGGPEKKNLKRHEISDMRSVLSKLQSEDLGPRYKFDHRCVIFLPLKITPPYQLPGDPVQIRSILQSACGKRNVGVSVLFDVPRTEIFIALGLIRTIGQEEILKFFAGLTRVMSALSEKILSLPDNAPRDLKTLLRTQSSICTEWSIESIENFMKCVSLADYRFTVSRRHRFVAYTGRGSKANAKILRTIAEMITDEQRKHEIRTHALALDRLSVRGSILSFIASINVVRPDGRPLTDIDGLSLVPKGRTISILMVESKDMHSRASSTARNQLERRVKDMGIFDNLENQQVYDIDDEGAYLYAPFKT
ncbi:MAG: hypothetical protein ACFFCW_07885 [Candidatus Hodarchaeota archaeon]